MTTALTEKKEESRTDTIFALIEKQKGEFAKVLPSIITPEEFCRVALTVIRMNEKLAQCSTLSLMGSLMKAAHTGIMPDGIRAYLIPYKNEASYMLSYKGMIELAMRSGDVAKVESRAIHEKDDFVCEFGSEEKLSLKPAWGDRGALIAVYAMAKMKDGSMIVEVMTKEEVDAIRARSKASGSGPWVTDYVEMARKTAVRRLAKYLPQAKDLLSAAGLEEREEMETLSDVDTSGKPPAKGVAGLKAALSPKAEEQPPATEEPPVVDAGAPSDPITKATATTLKRIASKYAGKGYIYHADMVDGLTESAATDYLTMMNEGDFRNIPFLVNA